MGAGRFVLLRIGLGSRVRREGPARITVGPPPGASVLPGVSEAAWFCSSGPLTLKAHPRAPVTASALPQPWQLPLAGSAAPEPRGRACPCLATRQRRCWRPVGPPPAGVRGRRAPRAVTATPAAAGALHSQPPERPVTSRPPRLRGSDGSSEDQRESQRGALLPLLLHGRPLEPPAGEPGPAGAQVRRRRVRWPGPCAAGRPGHNPRAGCSKGSCLLGTCFLWRWCSFVFLVDFPFLACEETHST